MSMQEKLNELTSRRTMIETGGGTTAHSNIKNGSSLSARDRVAHLLDENSFVEIGAFVKPRNTDFNMKDITASADGVVTGYGTVDGRLVYVFSQDTTVLGGSLGEMHAKKIVKIYEMAIKMGAPIVGLLDSAGMRLQESTDALEGFGQIFIQQSLASGVIPQIIGIHGTCAGSGAMLSSLSDFTFMKKEHSALYLNSANAIDGKISDLIQGSSFNAGVAGVVDVISLDDQTLLSDIRLLINVLPSHNKEEAPLGIQNDDLNRMIPEFDLDITSGLDGRSAVLQMVDFGTFLELKPSYGSDIVTGIGRIGGITAGFIASQGAESGARLTLNGCQKITEFVTKLDAFNLPIITMIDVIGFSATLEETKAGQPKFVAQMMNAFIGATVPKINILTNRAIGSAYVALNSKHIGADMVYAWPNALVAVMEAEPAVRIMYAKEIDGAEIASEKILDLVKTYEEEHMSPYAAASRGYIDDIIEPSATRKRVIAALDMLFTKYVENPDRKHRSV